ncbi:MAG: hypothetical protein B6242_02805 [Anaerolineaceae bacterium 4572_78]|nr:MAG: hypothetical protein B6242_02805 [Anaerolineaceae bacterium 4572_78]
MLAKWHNFMKQFFIYLVIVIVLFVSAYFIKSIVGLILAFLGIIILIGGGTWFIAQANLIANSSASSNYLKQAYVYHRQIGMVLSQRKDFPESKLLGQHIDQWINTIQALTKRVENLRYNQVIQRDLQNVPKSITDLEMRYQNESNGAIRQQLQHTLHTRRQQLASLEKLQSNIKQVEIQLENTLSSLGMIYTQLLTQQSTYDVSDYHALTTDVTEQVRMLEDSLDELEIIKGMKELEHQS